MSDRWRQPVLVENRVGAGGVIGADAVAKAAPDGYTLLMCSPQEVAVNHHVYAKVPYDPERDFAAFIAAESAKYAKIIREAGIKSE